MKVKIKNLKEILETEGITLEGNTICIEGFPCVSVNDFNLWGAEVKISHINQNNRAIFEKDTHTYILEDWMYHPSEEMRKNSEFVEFVYTDLELQVGNNKLLSVFCGCNSYAEALQASQPIEIMIEDPIDDKYIDASLSFEDIDKIIEWSEKYKSLLK